jgi:putative PIG3 family NAD(P)H quinone oxidoreductase
LIRVAASGVNRADVKQRQGVYPMPADAPRIPGLEVSGTIARVGEAVSEWRVGDMVCALVVGGGYAEYCLAPAVQCLPIPAALTAVEAAALPEALFTVWISLFEQASLQPGERLLVHGGASGIGTTAIQLATAFGAQVFTTAGTAAKCEACVRLGARRAINYREEDFVAAMMAATGGEGVDVVLDMVGAPYIERDLDVLATGGRLSYISYVAGRAATFDIQRLMLRRLHITGTTLRHRSIADKGRIATLLRRRVWPLLEEGRIRPVISEVFPLEQAAAAHRQLEGDGNVGKIVLTHQPAN